MRALILALGILVAMAVPAWAGMTCQRIGNFTYCTDDETGQTVVCQTIGTFTYCN